MTSGRMAVSIGSYIPGVSKPGQTLFVTGTDTGVGKTRVACALLRNLRNRGFSPAGYKPVASGAILTPEGLCNDDALALQAASTPGLGYDAVNPYCFEQPIAPHLAAEAEGRVIKIGVLDLVHRVLARGFSHVVIEGAGGWRVPLDASQTMADWVARHGWPVLLVVGVRLGYINHALLSAESIMRGTRLVGWVANCLPPAAAATAETIEALRQRMPAPLLGVIPGGADSAQIAAELTGAMELCFTPSAART